MADTVQLRDVRESDLPIFFELQRQPEANLMASFPARDQVAFLLHWKTKVLPDETVVKKAIIVGGTVVGYVVSWQESERRLIGYWIGQDHWGKGIATQALTRFLDELEARRAGLLGALPHRPMRVTRPSSRPEAGWGGVAAQDVRCAA